MQRLQADSENFRRARLVVARRRGKVLGMDKISEDVTVVNAYAPYSELLSYSPVLNSLTSGRGRFEMEISHYDPLPSSEYDKAKKQAELAAKAEAPDKPAATAHSGIEAGNEGSRAMSMN